MYKNALYRVAENRPIAREVFRMRLLGDTRWITAPGQFVNVRVDGCYLRRPISVCDWDGGGLTLLYRAVGKGTRLLSRALPGETLDLLTGLGNGYDPSAARGRRTVLIGGGVGVPPLYGLARRLALAGEPPPRRSASRRRPTPFWRRAS